MLDESTTTLQKHFWILCSSQVKISDGESIGSAPESQNSQRWSKLRTCSHETISCYMNDIIPISFQDINLSDFTKRQEQCLLTHFIYPLGYAQALLGHWFTIPSTYWGEWELASVCINHNLYQYPVCCCFDLGKQCETKQRDFTL